MRLSRLAPVVVCVVVTVAGVLASASASSAGQNPPQNEGPIVQDPSAPAAPGPAHGTGNFWAVVEADGTLVKSRKAIEASKILLGTYRVIFRNNMRNCAYTATVGETDSVGISDPAVITTAGDYYDVRGVYITVFDSTGAYVDRSFHLTVMCK